MGGFVLFQNRLSKVNRLFFFYSTTISLWAVLTATHSVTVFEKTSLFCSRIMHVPVLLIPLLFVHFTLALLKWETKGRYRNFLYLGYGAAVILGVPAVFGELAVVRVRPKLGYHYFMDGSSLYFLFIAFFSLFAAIGLWLLWRGIRRSTGLKRVQLQYLFGGSLLGYLFGASNFFPVYNVTIFPYPYGSLGITCYVFITAYGIVRYRLMDVNVALTRTSIFLLIYLFILGSPLSLVFWGKVWLSGLLGERWWMVPLGIYTTLATAGPFLYLLLQRKAEERLLREQRQYQQTLLQASKGMTLVKDLKHLLDLTVHILTRTIRITHASIYLLSEETGKYERRVVRDSGRGTAATTFPISSTLVSFLLKERAPIVSEEIKFKGPHHADSPLFQVQSDLDLLKASVIVPSFVRENLLGFLVLGEKRSGQIYTQDDLDTLSTLANQAALAFENCEFIKKVEQTQMQLFQAAKMADLGTMASGIAHQINNRLGVIKLGAETVCMVDLKRIDQAAREGKPEAVLANTAKVRESLGRVSASATKGSEIVRALLDFSRLSEGFKEVSFNEALEHALRLWECKKDLRAIRFENRVPAELPLLWANFTQLEEILINLLDNAYDAVKMKEEDWELGKIPKPENPEMGKVILSAGPITKNAKSYLRVEVSDTGIGMKDETRKQMFIPFFTTKATAIKGTGLGLFVIKQMVDAHKGEISIDSKYGEGAVFHLLLPLADKDKTTAKK